MNPRFKPFITESAEVKSSSRAFSVKIVDAAMPSSSFKPLSSVLPATAKGAAGGLDREPHGAAPVEPKLETRRDGDRISRITVTCDCGRLHDIECEY